MQQDYHREYFSVKTDSNTLLIEREFITSYINVHAKAIISNKVHSKKKHDKDKFIRIDYTFVIAENKYAWVNEITTFELT